MKWLTISFGIVLILGEALSLSSIRNSKINFLEEAKLENFNDDEIEILQPFTDIFQLYYDKLLASTDLSKTAKLTNNGNANDNASIFHFHEILQSIQPEATEEETLNFEYDLTLPNTDNLKQVYLKNLSLEEADDIQAILQESINDAHEEISNLIELSNEVEVKFIKINKIKIVKFIYKMVQKVYNLGIRAGRTAYCTYSSTPAINATLQEGSHNIGSCYNYTETSIGRLRKDVKTAISDIRGNVKELIKIYKKFVNRHSLLGKILTVILNVQKVIRDIKETKSIALTTLNEVKTDGPIIAQNIKTCATTSIPDFVVKLNATLTDLLTCITFVDDSTQGPEVEPESEEEDSLENLT